MALDLDRRYVLSPSVSLRAEAFGALAYNYDTRRLTFLKSKQLVGLVGDLEHHPTVGEALDEHVGDGQARRAVERALSLLLESEVIQAG